MYESDFRQQVTYWGYAASGRGDVAATISEQRHPTAAHRSPAVDALGMALWDAPDCIEGILRFENGRRRAKPYWWALPGVVTAVAEGMLDERRRTHYVHVA